MPEPPKHCGAPTDELAARRARLAETDTREQARAAVHKRIFDAVVRSHEGLADVTAEPCACGGTWIDGVHVKVTVVDVDDDPSLFLVQASTGQYVGVEDPDLQLDTIITRS